MFINNIGVVGGCYGYANFVVVAMRSSIVAKTNNKETTLPIVHMVSKHIGSQKMKRLFSVDFIIVVLIGGIV